jgi:hypothetical protein
MAEDKQLSIRMRSEITRRPIDSGQLLIRVSHGVVHINGIVKNIRGHNVDLKKEMEHIATVLRGKSGIRDVVIDVMYR